MLLLSETQQQIYKHIKAAAKELAPIAQQIESTPAFPQQAKEIFARHGLFTLAMPPEFGGPGADATCLALMVETIASLSPSAALLVFPTNAVLRTIVLTGTEEQKRRLLGELASGDKLMAFCLTEPDHGSDAAGLRTTARREGDYYVVSGTKSYITLGPHAHYYLTFVRTGPKPQAGGITALLIPRDAPGLSFGPPEKKMGLHGSVTAQMYMDGVRVPVENRLWAEGEGWAVLTRVANPMRVWGAAAMALGVSQGVLARCLELCEQGQARAMHEQDVAFALAEMKIRIEAVRSLIYRVCALLDSGACPFRELESLVSAAKCFAADTAMAVADMAAAVAGPVMARAGEILGLMMCAAKGIQIFDGTNQIQRLIVARNLARALAEDKEG